MDFSYAEFDLQPDLRVHSNGSKQLDFYDIWVARALDGNMFTSRFPWVQHDSSQQQLRQG